MDEKWGFGAKIVKYLSFSVLFVSGNNKKAKKVESEESYEGTRIGERTKK